MQHCIFYNRQSAFKFWSWKAITVAGLYYNHLSRGKKIRLFQTKLQVRVVPAGLEGASRSILIPSDTIENDIFSSMFVEIIADITCPWCFIGLKRFQNALKLRPHYSPAFQWRPFLLNPDLQEGAIARQEYLNRVFGSESRVLQFQEAINAAGTAVGIPFDFEKADYTPSSVLPHRFLLYAGRQTCPLAAADTLYTAFFVNGRNIGELSILVQIAEQIGLDPDMTLEYLESDRDHQSVLEENTRVHRLGVNGVPSFVFGKRNIISGAQEPQTLVNMLDFMATAQRLEEKNEESAEWV